MASNLNQITEAVKRIKPFKTKMEIKLPSKSDVKKSGSDYAMARKAISQGCMRASVIVERELPSRLADAMAMRIWGPFSPKFPYYRKNGELVGAGTRDLIDTGKLHDSLSIKTTFLQTKTVTTIQYSAPYARLVHAGGIIQPYGNKNATARILPGRPWVVDTLTPGGSVPFYDYTRVYNAEIAAAWKA